MSRTARSSIRKPTTGGAGAQLNACHRVTTIMLAMSKVVPLQMLTRDTTPPMRSAWATWGRTAIASTWGGRRRMGATSTGIGCADVVDGYVGNCSNVPVRSPRNRLSFMRVEEYALRRGSAGAGKHRGGLGAGPIILDEGVTFNSYSDRFKVAPWVVRR